MTVELELHFHYETKDAVLLSETGDHEKAVWLPKSQITWRRVPDSTIADVELPEWLAMDKGLI